MQDVLLNSIEEIIFWPGFGAVAGSVIAFISGLFAQKMQRNWQKSADKEIERLKADLSRNNSLVNGMLGHHGAWGQKVVDHYIASIDQAWRLLLQVKALVPPSVSTICNIFSDKELENGILDSGKGSANFGDELLKVSMQDFGLELGRLNDEIRGLRPFLSDNLALCVFTYSALLGRIVFVLSDTYKKGAIRVWRKDNGIRQILEHVLTEKELAYAYQLDINSFTMLTDLLEAKILNEMSITLSGRKMSEDILSQVNKWDSILSRQNLTQAR